MSHTTLPALHVAYDERRDVLAVRSSSGQLDALYELAPDTTLHYCSRTRQVMGITLRQFLSRFPLVACTISVEEHGAAIAREYLTNYPQPPA
jgi:hypothetical protein